MTISRSEDMLVGIVALALIPWIGWTISRGLRDGRLPIGRAHVSREERPGAFQVLLLFYALAALFALAITADLLFNFDIRNHL
jgi:hypothetical protein